MHHRTKFHRNRATSFGDIAFNDFQHSDRPPAWFFLEIRISEYALRPGGPICVIVQNFIEIGQAVAERGIAIYHFLHHLGFMWHILGPPTKSTWR